MRLRLRASFSIDFGPKSTTELAVEQHEHRDTETFLENTAVRYVGFAPAED